MNAINTELKLPSYLKTIIIFIGLIALFGLLYIAKSIVVPLIFAIIIAILLNPIVNFFVRIRINRVIAIIIALTITFIVIAAFGALFISQASRFSDSWPILVDKFTILLNDAISWAASSFDINPVKIHEWIVKTKNELISSSGAAIGQTLSGIGSGLLVLLLVPVYIFMILFYQPLILDFIHKLFGTNHQDQVRKIVSQTKTVIQHYLVGLVIEFIMVAVLNTVVLLIFGIEYAILLGIIGALLNLIPYIGGIVGVALPMIVALVTKTSAWYSIYVLIGYYIVQLIDNNLIVPLVVASKVKINALFSVIVVIVGNVIWGIPGMFLSIPLLAIVKLICDNIESLKPWGFLLGDTMPPLLSIEPILKKLKKKS
ncbi:MAG: AI-2E family transporter [Bacteroidales bacterium]|nr:MAG: AI-2E family transporter [Bacteroidales bacterium]